MSTVRPAAVAGTFYPADAGRLQGALDQCFNAINGLEVRLGCPKVLIVPHAGYIYSGGMAAHAYDELSNARGAIERVVLLGPVHRVPVRGLTQPA